MTDLVVDLLRRERFEDITAAVVGKRGFHIFGMGSQEDDIDPRIDPHQFPGQGDPVTSLKLNIQESDGNLFATGKLNRVGDVGKTGDLRLGQLPAQ